ncbi:hypothetical protein I1A62_30135 [Rhodococcus sp. USK10]|uniref:hypothetical protein n=1 Tax=Rhodococcus sp. USK10 TaxID=2789739 RepID=UPI001C5E4DC6|nr:hypothetical protein [Rhodococcus sp. USK10]QYB01489.1 hypothetical protein I1A62_30135 [Rhodococcus sp. USK10]
MVSPSPSSDLAGRSYARVYDVIKRGDIHHMILQAVEASGGRLLYASPPNRAPVYLGVQGDRDERIGLLIYPFRMTQRATRNRPDDEVRGQIRYGGEKSWLEDHFVGRDLAGVDVTLMLGVDVEAGLFVGLQPSLYDPLPMGISFYAKVSEMQIAAATGWHVWEKENQPGTKRSTPRGPTGLETFVGFTPNRLLDYARFERNATDLALDHALRFSAAQIATTNNDTTSNLHKLESEFQLSSQEILHIISTRNRLEVAVRGGVAEHHLERVLRDDPSVVDVARLDQDGEHDFDVTLKDGRMLRVECKNASPKAYANGDLKVEVQKTRASKNDPSSRYYRADQFDVVAACIYPPTREWVFRYHTTSNLERHHEYPDRLAPMQRVSESWAKQLMDVQPA